MDVSRFCSQRNADLIPRLSSEGTDGRDSGGYSGAWKRWRDQGVGAELVSVALTFHNTAPMPLTPLFATTPTQSLVARNCVPKMGQGGSYSVSSGFSTRFRTSPEASEKDLAVGLAEHEFFSMSSKKNIYLFGTSFVFSLSVQRTGGKFRC